VLFFIVFLFHNRVVDATLLECCYVGSKSLLTAGCILLGPDSGSRYSRSFQKLISGTDKSSNPSACGIIPAELDNGETA